MLNDSSYASISDVSIFTILDWLKLQDLKKKHGVEVTFKGMTLLLNLMKTTNWFRNY
jgi:hypothetical protein